MDQDELDDLQDPNSWDYDAAIVVPPNPDAGNVIAVRFAPDELTRLAREAAAAEANLAGFVHDAVLEKLSHRLVGHP